MARRQSRNPETHRRGIATLAVEPEIDSDVLLAARVGEWFRRVALGSTAALSTVAHSGRVNPTTESMPVAACFGCWRS